jgi:outer membrane protein assembly factor BamA
MRRERVIVVVVLLFALAAPARGGAQQTSDEPDTRAEALRREREARPVVPYKKNPLERSMAIVEDRLMPLLARDGLHWKLGSITTGSGFAYGGGFRNRRLFDREAAFTIWAAGSLKRYTAFESRLEFPDLADGHLSAGAFARHHNYPQESFFGLGPDSRRRNRSSFELQNTIVNGHAGIKPWRTTTFGGSVEYQRPRIDAGKAANIPTIDAIFDERSAPGLAGEHDFVRVGGSVQVDYRQPTYARRGGLYRLDVDRYADQKGTFDFRRIDADVRQYLSALAERRVLALRLFVSTSDVDNGGEVPFYLMPSLGGHDSLRGYRDYRFRGPHAILAQAEYRWELWSGLDAALFYDAGKVTERRSDLGFRHLNDAYGFGFRFNTDNGVIMKIDAGFGSRDGKHLYIVFGDVF